MSSEYNLMYNLNRYTMRKNLLLYALLLFAIMTKAQNVVYLIGTDGRMEANHASATLVKNDKGAYTGEVTFTNDEFLITTKLASSPSDWNSIQSCCWTGNWGDDNVRIAWKWRIYSGVEGLPKFSFPHEKETYWLKITFDYECLGYMYIYNDRTEDPDDPNYEGEEYPEEHDTGNHFKITIPQAGMLKSRLENAVFDTDYDMVDSLTVKGKFGGDDLKYLVEARGVLTELSYLDLTQVELVYDDKEYKTEEYSSGFYWATSNHYLFSSENRNESRNTLFGGKTLTMNTYYRNDFASAFKDNKTLKECRLPKSLSGVGEDTFKDCTDLKKVALPENSTYIGNRAFYATALNSMVLPASITTIGEYAFAGSQIEHINVSNIHSLGLGKGCFSNTEVKDILLSNGLESIPEEIFSNCSGLIEIAIPASVKTIGKRAFAGCENLYTVIIPGTVTTIEDGAFGGCSILRNLTMAEGVKRIGVGAFGGCWFQNVTIPSSLEEIGVRAFPYEWVEKGPYENGILYLGKTAYAIEKEPYTSDIKNGLASLNFKDGTITIADGFQSNAFEGENVTTGGFEQIKTITLPSSLRRIGDDCFEGAVISSITLPDALEHIGYGAFRDCKKLRRVTIPENVKYIGPGAFNGCGITRVYYNAIEADVYKWIDANGNIQYDYGSYNYVFADCPLVRVYIGEGVKKIPATIFSDCSSLARVQMASTVESIGIQTFSDCTSLEHIDLPVSLKEIGDHALPISNLKSVACYMKKPIDLDSSDEDILAHVIDDAGNTVYDRWQEELINGEDYLYDYWYPETPLGSTTGFYRIDANGKISWGYFETYNSYYLGLEVLDDAEVIRLWQEAMDRGEKYYYGTWYKQTEKVGDVECYYRIDANKIISFGYWKDGEFKINNYNMIWTDKVPTTDNAHISLLQVPKGLLSAYKSHPLWSSFIDKIETLDGASDAETIKQTTTVNVNESITEKTDLSNTMLGNIYVTLDTEDCGDGYNASEGCIVINSTVTEDALTATTSDDANDLTVKNQFNGLIFEVPAGKGSIVIDCQTLGQQAVYVKIGNDKPQQMEADNRQQLATPYEVSKTTRVYVYAAKADAQAAHNNNAKASALYSDVYTNNDAVKIYGLTINIDKNNSLSGDANGDGFITMADANLVVNYFLATDKSTININMDAANVNGDNEITMADANMIVNMFLGGQ